MRRVMIVGCPGAGKSTAARRLAARTGLPIVHLDRHYWQPGWTRPESAAWRRKVAELAAQPAWIIDGNYGSTLDIRVAAADTLIHLDFATRVCVWRVLKRTVTGLGTARRDEFVDGCPERLDWPFLKFVLHYRRDHRDRDLARLEPFAGTRYRFERPSEVDAFLAALPDPGRG
ncbi:hypothetical protein [Thalassobaculum sp.]|uniref:hypothetical protein n=1 Tax=Thalassobaculum sp. TaxID=2022740 RepID=UPI0032EF2856